MANTGDDFTHYGLRISPDIDTLIYTLAGENNQKLGWGRHGETWSFMQQLERLGGDCWFQLGDSDLALHIERTARLNRGESLGEITQAFCHQLGIKAYIWPMSNDPVGTFVNTTDGRRLPFQEYFVKEKCAPRVKSFNFAGADRASIHERGRQLMSSPDLRAIIICPSNPFVSIDPILSLPGFREAMINCPAPVIAISPIVDGKAIKGPAAKMLEELNLSVDAGYIRSHYKGLIQGVVLDHSDSEQAEDLSIPTLVTNTVMKTLEDRDNLAREALKFAESLSGTPPLEHTGFSTAGRM